MWGKLLFVQMLKKTRKLLFKKILFGITEGKGFIMQKKELKKSIWLLRYSHIHSIFTICFHVLFIIVFRLVMTLWLKKTKISTK